MNKESERQGIVWGAFAQNHLEGAMHALGKDELKS